MNNPGFSSAGRVILLKICFVLLLQPVVFSRDNHYIFKQIDPDNELAQAWVTAVSQDYVGFIWIGTSDGLYRYDGSEIKTYRSIPGNDNTLIGNNINAILESSDNNLWIATTKGISLYDRNNDCFNYRQEFPRENVSNMVEDTAGNIYFGSYNGLFVYQSFIGKITRLFQWTAKAEPFIGNQLLCLYSGNKILITGAIGISEFNLSDGTFSLLAPFPEGVNGNAVISMFLDFNGILWIGMRDYGLFYFNPDNSSGLRKLDLPGNHFLHSGTVLSILESSDSLLWIGTENNGIALLDLNEFNRKSTLLFQVTDDNLETGLINNSVYSLYEDRHENIWIGTYGGLNLYNAIYTNFQHFKTSDKYIGLNNNCVNVFLEDGNELWVGTEGGVNVFNKITGRFSYLEHSLYNRESLGSNAVYSITKDRDGYFWIGTWSGGLNRYNPKTQKMTHYAALENDRNSISNNNIFSLATDEHGNVWIGTMGGGLNKYNISTGAFTHYRTSNTNPANILNDWVRQVFFDSKGRLWVSTYNSLELMDRERGTFYHFTPDEDNLTSISDNGTLVIFEDSKKNMWFGTETGLHLFHEQDSSFIIYRTSQGLPSNVINAILEDNQGNLWMSTNNGITKFVNGIKIPAKPEFVTFNVRDGLQGNKFNQRSALKDSNGLLYFGGKNGYNRFDPEKIERNSNIPPVIITEFLVFNKTEVLPGNDDAFIEKHISLADKIWLKYKFRAFTINYVSLNYLIPEKNQYKYMLEGFEENWNEAGEKRSATYTNLDPGQYTFRVIASNGDNVWNTEGTKLQIIILPPWYRTFWAYAGYFIIILAMILGFRRLILIRSRLEHELVLQRVEKEKIDHVSKMKTRFFTNISHEFRTPLTLIIGPLENLLSDINLKPTINRQLNNIQKNAKRLLRLINQLLDISEIEADHLKLKVNEGDIVAYIKEIASLFRWLAGQKNITYSINSNKNQFIGYFDSDKIEKICYNLIANAFKFTPLQGKINIEIDIVDQSDSKYAGYLNLRISDSGIGISDNEKVKIFEPFYRTEKGENMSQDGSGVGLALVNGLISVYRGDIEVKSSVDIGTEFTVYLPLQKSCFKPEEIGSSEKSEIPLTLDIYDLEQGFSEAGYVHVKKENVKDTNELKPLILLVEDHEELRSHLAEQFSLTYQVVEAGNGKEALELAVDLIPDLVITDIRMPVMDGIELCSRLKTNVKTSHIPIILLTAKVSDEDRLKGLDTGADAYITKPFEPKILVVTVKNLIEKHQQLKEKYSRSMLIEPTEISITSLDEKFLRKAIAIVEKNIADPEYSVDTFSKDIGMSRSHLHRKFVGLTGHSPSGFIRTLRMKRAAQLLTKGQLTVSEILYAVGIKSRSYFTKSFKEQFGESPTDFASKNKISLRNTMDIS